MGKARKFIKGFKIGQKSFGESIATVVNSILLTFVYFVGAGLTFVAAKLFGKHFLDLEINKKTNSYWSDLNLGKKPMKEYYRQF